MTAQAVQCLNHDVAGVMLINAMSRESVQNLQALFQPVKGEVMVEMKINGHPVDFVKTVEECWDRLHKYNEQLAMKRALEMITAASLEEMEDLNDLIRSFKGAVRDKLTAKFPGIEPLDERD